MDDDLKEMSAELDETIAEALDRMGLLSDLADELIRDQRIAGLRRVRSKLIEGREIYRQILRMVAGISNDSQLDSIALVLVKFNDLLAKVDLHLL